MTRLDDLRAPDRLKGDLLLDTVGLYCPIPIIRTAEAAVKLDGGRIIEVLSDDRVILYDMPAWCRSAGHEYLGYREEEDHWRLFVRKK